MIIVSVVLSGWHLTGCVTVALSVQVTKLVLYVSSVLNTAQDTLSLMRMARIAYINKNFYANSRWLIQESNTILEHYSDLGLVMTLRQLYYQLVRSNKIPNNIKSYNNLGNVIGDARLAGEIDWNHILDRGRNLRGVYHFNSPLEVIQDGVSRYRIDMWENQNVRPEIWIEKDALSGVFEDVCAELDVDLLACKGYLSLSESHKAAMRLQRIVDREDKMPIIFHFGDHDSSGLDMTRDIKAKFDLFAPEYSIDVQRIALTMAQIKAHGLPPQFAKQTDPRAPAYTAQFGNESWELDALDPETLTNLVRSTVEGVRDEQKWNEALQREKEETDALAGVEKHWKKVVPYVHKLENPKPRKPRKKKASKKSGKRRKVVPKKSRSTKRV
jgi:hypothetical protein